MKPLIPTDMKAMGKLGGPDQEGIETLPVLLSQKLQLKLGGPDQEGIETFYHRGTRCHCRKLGGPDQEGIETRSLSHFRQS